MRIMVEGERQRTIDSYARQILGAAGKDLA
ncbi:MAG: hypothetical protein VB934_15225 [Polyangiaceae bacterium]